MRDRLLFIGVMIAIAVAAFLWFGGAGLLVVGILATIVCVGGLGGFYIMNPTKGTWHPVGAERIQAGGLAKRGACAWGLVVAVPLAALGVYLFEVPGPLS